MVKWFNWAIKKSIDDLLDTASDQVNAELKKINEMVMNEQPYTFDITSDANDIAMNMTMTKAPSLAPGSREIMLNFDGTFHQMKNATNVPSTVAYPMVDHDFFPNLVNSHRQ